MTRLEEAIQNVPYSTDYFKMRNRVTAVVVDSIETSEWHHVLRTSLDSDNFIQFVLFQSEDVIFVWSDIWEDGKIEGSQLEQVINEYLSHIIYSHNENSVPIAPVMFKLMEDKKLYNWD
ncbi:MAG: hypothetical protein MJZ86_02125 [Bacteroidales bacterium]|nr:hypothetical protein [Bacteroidales bacterium]